MNAIDILKYGHLTVLNSIEDLPDDEWNTPNVCGVWSCREIIAHLASFERMLVEVLGTFIHQESTPTMARMGELGGQGFNEYEVAARKDLSWKQIVAEYTETQAETMGLISQIPSNTLRKTGALPWYGPEYDLEDFLVYTYYGHKREHTAQINVFLDTLGT